MKTCNQCNIEYDDSKKFCKQCGSSLETAYNLDPKHAARKEVLEERIKADPLNVELLKEYAGFLSEQLLYNDAIAIALKILAINEKEAGVKVILFNAYAGLKKWDQAIETAEEILAQKSNDAAFLYQLAVCYYETDKLEKAIPLYDAVLMIEPDHSKALYEKALVLLENKHIPEAAAIFGKLKADGINDETTNIYAGIDKVIKQEYEAAVAILKPALSKDGIAVEYSDHSRGFLAMAYALMKSEAPFTDIRKWFNWINLPSLKEDYHEMDEEWHVAIASNLLNYELKHFFATTEYAVIEKLKQIVAEYFAPAESYVTDHTKALRACMWHELATKQLERKRLADALVSLDKAAALDPDEIRYREKREETKALFESNKQRKKHRKIIFWVVLLSVIVIAVVALQINKRYQEKRSWETAQANNTYTSYQRYIRSYPEGRFIVKAVELQEEAVWAEAKKDNSIAAYEQYLNRFPHGKHAGEAQGIAEDLFWENTLKSNSREAYRNYIARYPNGKYLPEASDHLLNMQREEQQRISEAQRIREQEAAEARRIRAQEAAEKQRTRELAAAKAQSKIEQENAEAERLKELEVIEAQRIREQEAAEAQRRKEDEEAIFWQEVLRKHSIEAYYDYYVRYPYGQHYTEALNFLNQHVKQAPNTLTNFRNRVGSIHYFKVRGTNSGSVWGGENGIYTDDSIIGKAAVHAGVAKIGEEAIVKVKILQGQTRYRGSNQNGVRTSNYGRWHGSYKFE